MKIVYCSFLLCLVMSSQAQDSLPPNKFEFAINSYYGTILRSYPNVPESKGAWLNSIGCYWQTQGKDQWHQFYHFPKYGFELFYSDFGNKEFLGQNLGFVPTLELKSKKENKHWRLKFGLGASYFNKPFDAITNPTNFYIGGHFTNMTVASLFWSHRIFNKLAVTYGIGSVHCSNGHTTLPNAGMNMITGHLGLRFENSPKYVKLSPLRDATKLSYAVKSGLGFHKFGSTTKAVGGPSYPSYHLSFWVSKPKKNIHLWQAGFISAYYSSYYDYIVSQQVYSTQQHLRSMTGIVFGGHEFVFGKFSFSTQAGIYVYNPFFKEQKKIEGTWKSFSQKLEAINTNRLGLIYYPLKKRNALNNVNSQLMLGAFIKANVGQADLFEYCVGYVF